MTEPIEVTLTIDLNKHLASLGYDSDGEPTSSPTTVEDVVLQMAADRLIRQMGTESFDWRRDLRRRVAAVRDEMIAHQIRPDVEAALLAPVQKTNGYGDPVGEATTMRDLIVAQVEGWLKSSNPKGLTKPQQIIAEQVDKVLAKEMKEAVDKAKAEVTAAVKAKGAELLAQTITAMAGGK